MPAADLERLVYRLVIVTVNVGRAYKAARRVRRVISRVLAHYPGAVIGWQEIDEADPGDEHGLLGTLTRRLLRTATAASRHLRRKTRRGWRNVGFGQLNPISLPRGLPFVGKLVKRACDGRAHKTPPRKIVLAYTEIAIGDRRLKVTFLNVHLPYKTPDLWAIAVANVISAVEAEVDAGRIVFLTMDSNHHGRTPEFHPRQRVLVGEDGGIDKVIAVIPRDVQRAGVQLRLIRENNLNLDIDGHDARAAVIDLSVPAAA